jgi:hypothetical protein
MQMGSDLHHNIKLDTKGISPVAVGTTGIAGGVLTAAIDRAGYRGVEFIFGCGTIPSTTESLVPIIYESDASTGGFTSVADADLLGTETLAGIAAGTRTSGTTKNCFKSIGYVGNKRYVKARYYGVGTATALVSIGVVLHEPRHAPPA